MLSMNHEIVQECRALLFSFIIIFHGYFGPFLLVLSPIFFHSHLLLVNLCRIYKEIKHRAHAALGTPGK